MKIEQAKELILQADREKYALKVKMSEVRGHLNGLIAAFSQEPLDGDCASPCWSQSLVVARLRGMLKLVGSLNDEK